MKAGELMLAVQAKGFAPAVQTIQMTGMVAGLTFQLGPGQLLLGRVIDEDGNPISNAWAETTRGRRKIAWSATTDVNGRFEWDSAPQEPLLYSFQADGFNRAYALKLQADGSEHEIKLTREKPGDTIEITGTAVDADSGEPLNAFKVMLGELEPDFAFPFAFLADGKDGEFSASLSPRSNRTYQIQIEKEGYLPALTAPLLEARRSQTLEFRLRKGSGPSGFVVLPSGEPAVNATVLLCTPRASVRINGPARIQSDFNTTKHRAQTDQTGRFSLAPATDPEGIVAVHNDGYAEVSLEATGSILLQPWGRVEGTVILDSKPAANERVVAHNSVARYSDTGRRFTFTTFYFEAQTDATGKFWFDKVPPGRCDVFRQTQVGRTGFESHDTSVVVNPGAVTEVVLGGGGRAIIGRAVVAGATKPIDWKLVPVHLKLKTGNEPGPRPKRGDFATREAYIEAADYFFEAYRAQRRFGTLCDANGAFRLPYIPAGQYKLEITVRGFKPAKGG